MKNNYSFLFVLVVLSSGFCYSQTGLSGEWYAVGSNSQPKNLLWLNADLLRLRDGTLVSVWTDESGNENGSGYIGVGEISDDYNIFENRFSFTDASLQRRLCKNVYLLEDIYKLSICNEIVYTWIGTTSDWFTAENWSDGIVPGPASNVIIENVGIDPVINNITLAQVKDLTISSGATLTLQAGARMTTSGYVTTNGGLVIENSVSEPTSFLNIGTVTGDVQVDWTYPDSRYMYVGHSVNSVSYNDYDKPTSNPFNMSRHTGSWSQITGAYNFDSNELEGYAVKFTDGANVDISHAGTLRYGSYSQSINGWHLIANPYQTYIDIEHIGFDMGNALPTVWTSTNASGEIVYVSYNRSTNIGTNGGTRYIAPNQSFWLRNYSASTFSIDPTVRLHATGELKSIKESTGDVLRITLNNEGYSDEVVLVFRPEGSMDLTTSDSPKLLGACINVPNVYVLKENVKLVIALLPDNNDLQSLPLGYKFLQEKEIVLKVTNIKDLEVWENVFLIDKLKNMMVNFRKTDEYIFRSTAGEDASRFVLLFDNVVTSVLKEEESEGTNDVLIYAHDSKGIVRVCNEILNQANGKGRIRVYSSNGELLEETRLLDVRTEIDLPGYMGVYIIKVQINNKTYGGKIIKTE